MFEKLELNYRIYLRAFVLDDAKTTHQWRIDDEVINGLVGRKYFVSPDYEKKWMENVIFDSGNSIKLAVCIKETNQHIGNVYLDKIDAFNQNAMFSLMIGEKKFWNSGFGTELTILMLHHAFYEMNLKRVYSYQLKDNIRSIKLHEKCGFLQEGTLRKAVFKHGKFVDLNVMAILKDEFDKKITELINNHNGEN